MFLPTDCLKTKEVDDTENRRNKWHINNLSARAVCSNPAPVDEVSYKHQTSCGMEIRFLLLVVLFFLGLWAWVEKEKFYTAKLCQRSKVRSEFNAQISVQFLSSILVATVSFSHKLNPSTLLPTPRPWFYPVHSLMSIIFPYSMSNFQIWPEPFFSFLHINRRLNSKMDLQSWIPQLPESPFCRHNLSVCVEYSCLRLPRNFGKQPTRPCWRNWQKIWCWGATLHKDWILHYFRCSCWIFQVSMPCY